MLSLKKWNNLGFDMKKKLIMLVGMGFSVTSLSMHKRALINVNELKKSQARKIVAHYLCKHSSTDYNVAYQKLNEATIIIFHNKQLNKEQVLLVNAFKEYRIDLRAETVDWVEPLL
jgi:penicillin-binding protein-related factor A (putative recombinase)